MDFPYLVVDLDYTLVRSDTLFDLFSRVIRHKPWMVFQLAFVLLTRGRAQFKNLIVSTMQLDVTVLPYRKEILDLCQEFRSMPGQRQIILASASDLRVVSAVSEHLKVFDKVLGTSPEKNLKGLEKVRAIRSLVGSDSYIYVGDSSADLPIWRDSAFAVLVNPKRSVLKQVESAGINHRVIRDHRPLGSAIMKQLRVHQWIKNLLVFVPFIAAHRVWEREYWYQALLAFFSFSCLASAVYILNDLLDIESDRRHPSKRLRPFASGDLPASMGFIILPCLLILAGTFASFLPLSFGFMGLLYLALNVLYTFSWKEIIVLDVVILGSFYTMRILAGGLATGVSVSLWLLSFSTFFFFGLAMVKRYTELIRTKGLKAGVYGRGYHYDDQIPVAILGIGSSLLALLVLAVYFNSPAVQALYKNSENMWPMIPLLLYWTGRIWILAYRGEVHDDPVIFAIKDRASWIVAFLFFMLLIVSL